MSKSKARKFADLLDANGDLDLNSNDINFGDSDKAIFGAGSDLQIYHDGSNSYVADDGTGTLNIQSNGTQINLQKPDGTKMIEAINNGNVVLYSNGVERVRANGTGVSVTGTVTATAFSGDGSGLTGLGGGEGGSKAWAAFEQAGTHSFRDSFNFSSLSDIGTGQTRFSLTSNMANANYATTGCSGEQSGGGNRIMGIKGNSAAPATTGFDIANFALSNGSASDDTRLSVSVLGDQ